jgi:hypothetical protein
MSPFLSGFADELVKLGAGDKAVPRMPPVAGGRPEYKASGSFKPQVPKMPKPEPMKYPGQ